MATRTRAWASPRGTWPELIEKYPADVQAVAKRLRAIVRDVLPRAEEAVWTGGWRVALYRDGSEICGIGPMKQGYVNFYFTRGADLDDPHGLLEGNGKGIRHVKVRPGQLPPTAALKRLIRAGKALATSRRRRVAKKK